MKGTSCYSFVEITLLILFFWRILEPSYNKIPVSPGSMKANKKHVLEESFYSAPKSNHFWGWEGGCFGRLIVLDTLSSEAVDKAGRCWDAITGWKASAQAVLPNSVQPLQLHISGDRDPLQPSSWGIGSGLKRAEGGPHAGPCR